jgi:hypothetical protein
MKKALGFKKLVWMLMGAGGLLFGFLMFGSNSVAMQEDKGKKMNLRRLMLFISKNAWDVTFQLPILKRRVRHVMTGIWWFKRCKITGLI